MMNIDDINKGNSSDWSFNPPDTKEIEKLKKLILDSFGFDTKKLDDFLSQIIWSPDYNLYKIQDEETEQKKLDDKNEVEIKRAIKEFKVGKYKSIKFSLKLDPGSRDELKTINIRSSKLERRLYDELLRSLTEESTHKYDSKRGRKYLESFNIRCAIIITKSFCFINAYSTTPLSKQQKFYFAGLALVLGGGLKTEAEFNKDGAVNYVTYKSYLSQNAKKYIQKLRPEKPGMYSERTMNFFASLLIEKNNWEPQELIRIKKGRHKNIFRETVTELFGEYPEITLK